MTQPYFPLAEIVAALGEHGRYFDVDVLAECDSTNSRLLSRAEAGAASGTVIVAERQTAGRGRLGRIWHSEPGASLTFSLLWRFADRYRLSGLSLAVGVAVAQALQSLGVAGMGLKWPNDILVNHRKLGGILVETIADRQIAAIIGIGLNMRLPASLPTAIEAAAIGATVPPAELLARLLIELRERLLEFAETGFPALRDRWQALNAFAGVEVNVLAGSAPPLAGVCVGVDNQGALLLETGGGRLAVFSGEVSLRRA